jgi:large subunit ribosomal protein L10
MPSEKNRAIKDHLIQEMHEAAMRASCLLAAEYRGLSAADMDALRRQARDAAIFCRVIKNTLARQAMSGTPYEGVADRLAGPLVYLVSHGEAPQAAKVLADFIKGHEQAIPKVVALPGRVVDVDQLSALAAMPSREVALSQLLGTLQAPVARLVQTMAAPLNKLAATFEALRMQQQGLDVSEKAAADS